MEQEATPPTAPKDPPAISMTSAPPATPKKSLHRADKTCPKCGKVAQSRQALRVHLDRVFPCDKYPDGTNTCHKCGRAFRTAASFTMHMSKATPCDAPATTRVFKCEKCNEVFTSAQGLLAHRSRVYACDDPTRKRTWWGSKTCPKCNMTFSTGQSLRIHLNKVIPCNAEKSSTSGTNASGKERTGGKAQTHPKVEMLHSCPLCQRSFATKHGLHVHMARCPMRIQFTKPQSVMSTIAITSEEQSLNNQVNVAIRVASAEPFDNSRDVNQDDASEVSTATDSPCSSSSTEAKGTGVECSGKDLPLRRTAVGMSISQSGNRKRSVGHGGEELSPVEKSTKRVCTDTGIFAKLETRLAENCPSTTANEKARDYLSANEATASESKEFVRNSNCDHGGDILSDGCCCRSCVRKWTRKMTIRLGNLANEVENLRGMTKAGASGTNSSPIEDICHPGAEIHGFTASNTPPSPVVAPGDISAGLSCISEQDPGKISLMENYNHVNGQVSINERALGDSMEYLNTVTGGDELSSLEMRDQIDELCVYLNAAKSKRDKAVAAIIAHRWSARRDEFRLLLEKMTVQSKPDAEKVFHEECADIAAQLVEKDQAISELKKLGPSSPTKGKHPDEISEQDAEQAAKTLLERERDDLFMRLLRSSRCIYLLAKETFLK
ncbi:hypothetical protein PF003_g32461 [Phytophthora fragariae]|nr:hypothetical protein PF003_g32461 [Phytophthora fragariae]